MSNTYVIKLGGSAVSTKDNVFDFGYLKKLQEALEPSINRGDKFFIVLGGGYVMRMYRDIAKAGGVTVDQELHWIGTTVNVLHATLAKAYFHGLADDDIVKFEDYYDDSPFEIKKSLKFGGGGRPGHSGDVDAIIAAKKLGAKKIYSLKNVDGVYSADPRKDSNAELKTNLSWDDYFDIIGHKTVHEPGGNYPIDPIGSQMSKDMALSFYIIGAKNLDNLKLALNGDDFHGTKVG